MPDKIDTGDTAWLLVSCALVLLMTPGLALFYGGMVRGEERALDVHAQLAAIPILSVKWALFGYSLAFGPTHGGFIGDFSLAGLSGLAGQVHGTVPAFAFCAFQMMFAVITPALISGAFAERMKFSAYVVFILAWSTFVYDPVAHWVWADGGWLFKMGALDFAGGTVVHLTAGASALVCALMVGPRLGYPKERPIPHNLTMTLTGAGILWFGWFGFNAGSALGFRATGIPRLHDHPSRRGGWRPGLVGRRVGASQQAHCARRGFRARRGARGDHARRGFRGPLGRHRHRIGLGVRLLPSGAPQEPVWL